MQFIKLATGLALAAVTLAAPLHAQTVAEAGLSVGAIVYGPQGNEVGKIERIDGEVVILHTGTNSAALSGASFAKGAKGPVIGLTRAQLDEAVSAANQQKEAQLTTALVPGATVRSSDGSEIAKVKTANEGGSVVLETAARSFSLDRKLFSTDDKGLVLLITAKQLNEALTKTPDQTPVS